MDLSQKVQAFYSLNRDVIPLLIKGFENLEHNLVRSRPYEY